MSLTCPLSPPGFPSGKWQSPELSVSALRSSACAAGCDWKYAGRKRLWWLLEPDSAAHRSGWIEPRCTEPHSQSGNNRQRLALASPGPLLPPAWRCERGKVRFLIATFSMISCDSCVSIVLCEEEPSASVAECQLCDRHQELEDRKGDLKRKGKRQFYKIFLINFLCAVPANCYYSSLDICSQRL